MVREKFDLSDKLQELNEQTFKQKACNFLMEALEMPEDDSDSSNNSFDKDDPEYPKKKEQRKFEK